LNCYLLQLAVMVVVVWKEGGVASGGVLIDVGGGVPAVTPTALAVVILAADNAYSESFRGVAIPATEAAAFAADSTLMDASSTPPSHSSSTSPPPTSSQ